MWLAYQQGQIFETFQLKDNFIDMANKFGISKSTMVFKASILKFINKYPRMKRFSLSLHFWNNSFKIIKEICHENAGEFI